MTPLGMSCMIHNNAIPYVLNPCCVYDSIPRDNEKQESHCKILSYKKAIHANSDAGCCSLTLQG